jgi:aldose 1-epimerase
VIGTGADGESAWLTGLYRGSSGWPAEHELELTVRLTRGTLRLEAVVRNPDAVELPFGLGYHPYFLADDEAKVEVPAARYWALTDNLPAGETAEVDAARDLNRPRRLGDLKLDDVLTALPPRAPRVDGLIERGTVSGPLTVRVFCSAAYREMVVFTPPHRKAFCIEPYTCTTDAINLQARGVDAGWLTLPPGGEWKAVVELWV